MVFVYSSLAPLLLNTFFGNANMRKGYVHVLLLRWSPGVHETVPSYFLKDAGHSGWLTRD